MLTKIKRVLVTLGAAVLVGGTASAAPLIATAHASTAITGVKVFTGAAWHGYVSKPRTLYMYGGDDKFTAMSWRWFGGSSALTTNHAALTSGPSTIHGHVQMGHVLTHNGHRYYEAATFTDVGVVYHFVYTGINQANGKRFYPYTPKWQLACPDNNALWCLGP